MWGASATVIPTVSLTVRAQEISGWWDCGESIGKRPRPLSANRVPCWIVAAEVAGEVREGDDARRLIGLLTHFPP
jgi:hypothetical protein